MSNRLPPPAQDPAEPELVRELIDAGRELAVTDYDFDRGLQEHLSQVQLACRHRRGPTS
jgi:hypothetical protein